MRIKRRIAVLVTLAATLAAAMGLAAPAYAEITNQECLNRGGEVYRTECKVYVSDPLLQPGSGITPGFAPASPPSP